MIATLRIIGGAWLPIGFCILLWETVSRTGVVNPLLFPAPSTVMAALWELCASGRMFTDAAVSLWRVIAGLGIGALVGVGLGIATGRVAAADRALSPVINILRPLPPVAILPLIIVWCGIDDAAKIFSIALATFFPVWLSTHIGARQIPREFLWSATLLSSRRWTTFVQVELPACLPYIVAGVRSAIAMGFIMVFVSELAGADGGLGYRISITQLAYRVDQMMAGLIVLSLLSVLLDGALVRGTRRFFPWLTFA